MKKLLLFLISYFLIFTNLVFASFDVNINIDKNTLNGNNTGIIHHNQGGSNENTDAIDNGSLQGTEETKQQVKDLKGNEMKDIYDNKRQLFISPINFIWTLFYILFFVVVLVIYNYYLKIKNKAKEVKSIEFVEKKEEDYLGLLRDVENKYLSDKKEVFYAKLGEILRLYLDDKVFYGLSTKTLLEIRGNVEKDLFILIEKLYYPEYNGKEDNIGTRKNILQEVRDYFKNFNI